MFPNDFVEFILKYNGGRPINNLFHMNGNSESVFKTMLSFNSEDKDNVYMSFDSQYKDSLIAVAIDEFGNLICYERTTNNIVFLNHELDEIEFIASNWEDFINNLYSDLKA